MRTADYSQIVKRIKLGDASAFEEIYKSCYAFVNFTCQAYCDSKEDIEEVVQDTFFAAFRDIHKLNDEVSFLKWLKGIAIHKCYDKFGKVKKDNEHILNIGDLTDLEIEEINKAFLPSDYCEDNEMRTELLGVVGALPEVQRKIIYLYYYANFNTTEIAKLHGCTAGYVYKALFTARNNIKEKLQATGTYGGFVPLGAIFLAEEAAFVEKYVMAGTYVAGTGAAIANAVMQSAGAGAGIGAGTATAGATAGAVASGTSAGAAGTVAAKTAISTYAAIAAACVLTTGLIVGGVYYAIVAPNPQDEETMPTEIGMTEEAQYENTLCDGSIFECYDEIEQCYDDIELYYNDAETQDGAFSTNQTANNIQEDISVTGSGFYEEANNYGQAHLYEEPQLPTDNTAEILLALNNATTASDVASIINRHGFSRLITAQGSNGEMLRFYSVDQVSGEILLGVQEDEWRMKFQFFENSVINIPTSRLIFWMD